MKLLVTGGLGFIGMNFINYWLNKYNDEIINLDKITYASNDTKFLSLPDPEKYQFVKGDICDETLVKRLVSEVDCVVNFAAESHVDNSIKNSHEFLLSNIFGTHNLLNAVKEEDKRFHHISTDEVFGSLEKNSKEQFNEHSCYRPQNPYSATKASADHLVNSYINTYGIKATISNCSNNYGPLQHPEKLIPKTILNLLSGKKTQLYGNGLQIRDWIYVEDHCSAIDLILKKGEIGENYLIGAENEKTNLEVVTELCKVLGRSPDDSIEYINDRPGHDVRYAIDPDKIQKELGWNANYNFEVGIKETVSFYKSSFS